jgi:hypothetical protein
MHSIQSLPRLFVIPMIIIQASAKLAEIFSYKLRELY